MKHGGPILNGVEMKHASDAWRSETDAAFNVNAGDVFGFYIRAESASAGVCEIIFNNFRIEYI